MKKPLKVALLLSVLLVALNTSTAQTLPQNISLVWEGDSVTHAFYRGKSIPARGAEFRIIAIPPTPHNPQSLVYTWQLNGRILGSLSGIGKQSLSIEPDIVGNVPTLRVDVKTSDGTSVGWGLLTPPIADAAVYLYEDNPALGIKLERMLPENFDLQGNEINIQAVPFFYSSGTIVYRWKLNQSTVSVGGSPSLTVRAPETGGGTSLLSLEAIHQTQLFQEDAAFTYISFE